MSRKSFQRQRSGRRKDRDISHRQDAAKPRNPFDAGLLTDEQSAAREKYFFGAVLLIFLAFSIYKAVVLFGAIPVPNPDYSGFVKVGRELTRLELPSNYKRAPVLGTLQVLLGHLMGGDHPILTASWLLNAMMSCGNILLLCLIGRKIIGRAGIWLALIVVLSPGILRYQAVPIAETAMIFFFMLTFFLLMKPTRWAYAAAAAASMVRYEGAVLIAIVFLMDMFFFFQNQKTAHLGTGLGLSGKSAVFTVDAGYIPELGIHRLGSLSDQLRQGQKKFRVYTFFLADLGFDI